MTAAVATTTPRPVLYLVPGRGRPRTGPVVRPRGATGWVGPPLPTLAADLAVAVLGTVFAPVATRVAARFAARAPLLARRGGPDAWASAIVFLLAEEARLYDYDPGTTRTSLARELGTGLTTVRRRAEAVRATLDAGDLQVPDPDLA